jgi:hypothetical protein
MPIKVACPCGQKFSAKDSMAGKRVKCPKCNEPLVIPSPKPTKPPTKSAPAISDLLDEVGVRGSRTGPVCPECGEDMQPHAIICINCGFNTALGRRMYTEDDNYGYEGASGSSVADKLMEKAERELDETPIDAASQDFGDGAEAWLIAGIAGFVTLVMLALALVTFFVLDFLPKDITLFLSFIAASLISFAGGIWITIVGFLEKPLDGILCFCCGPYLIYYAITRGLWVPLIMWFGGGVLANILRLVEPSDEFSMLVNTFFT